VGLPAACVPAIYIGSDLPDEYSGSFHAELVIRHSENRKLYLYDIINIKKETSTPLEP
jgi:hypothetical protein